MRSETNKGKKMRSYLIPLLIAFLLLFGCSGEGYVKVMNDTDNTVMFSLNNLTGETLTVGDTSDIYTIPVMKGVVNNIPITATGEYVINYDESISLTDGETVLHRIMPNVASIRIVNGSVDSASCIIEGHETDYYEGNDSTQAKYVVDGEVEVEYGGRYMFTVTDILNWFPGNDYRYELVPNACEIQLNNLHPTWTIYYVYISPSTVQNWGEDRLGDDVLETGYGYLWKANGDVLYDMQVQAADPHPDSTTMHVYEYYDTDPGCLSDFTWIYEFPTIFTAAEATASSKITGPVNNMMKPAGLAKVFDAMPEPSRITKIRKVDAGKAGLKALRK